MYVCMCIYSKKETGGQPSTWKRWQKTKKYFLISDLAIPSYSQTSKFLFPNWPLLVKHKVFTLATGPVGRCGMRGRDCQVS